MAQNLYNSLTLNFKQILIDEIALNGLAGISFDLLWLHVEKRISTTLTAKMKQRFWSYLCGCDCLSFYRTPERPKVCTELLDRFKIIDDDMGELMDPPVYLDGDYEYCPIENQGSCSNFHTRKEISKEELKRQTYEVVWAEFETSLVVVASAQERWRALGPHVPPSVMMSLSPLHYCILELVGKSRENGQMTSGKTNIMKIIKEPKFLFYNRKHLQELKLIKLVCLTVKHADRGMKSLLIRLNRFHKPTFLSMPKHGTIYKLKQYLLEQPNYCAKTSQVTARGLLTPKTGKRLQKSINVFKFDEKLVQPESSNKNKGVVKRRFISLQYMSDESSQSEDEDSVPLQCQYRVGVDLLRQAYERLLEAGIKGLTQNELSQLLGIEFYTSRTICRLFMRKHIVREHLEDKGKQRTARYFAVAAATGEMDQIYEEQKQKLQEYVKLSKLSKTSRKRCGTLAENIQDEDDVPLKKIKQEAYQLPACQDTVETFEIKVLDGVENLDCGSLLVPKKPPTLRQLKFTNGLLKTANERQVISGYQTLSSLIANVIGESPMDTKAFKILVQKMVNDGLLKLIKIKWPGFQQKFSILICAPSVQCTDPIIKEKQKEISIRAVTNRKVKKAAINDIVLRPPAQYAYPRYMKIQLLHEFLMKLIYFEDQMTLQNLPIGFSSLVNIVPEISVEFAIGNVSHISLNEILHLKIEDDVLPLKLRDAPEEVYQTLLQSKSLQNSIRINLKVLAMLGLVQLVNEVNSQATTMLNFIFYVNRHAKILDTTGSWPREENDAPEKSFYFESFEDVKTYWQEVYEISTHTTIEYGNRKRTRLMPPLRPAHEVEAHDCGLLYGNGAGPCGFDACFYMDNPRYWKTFYTRFKTRDRTKPIIKKQPFKRKPKVLADKKPKKLPKKEPKKTKPKPVVQEKQKIPRTIIPRKRIRQTTPATRWTKWEDTVLMMCKVAITILSPVSQPGCLKIRNNAARALLGMFDSSKDSSSCHRRSLHIESDLILEHEKECLINELRRKRHLIVKYEGLVRKLKIRHITNMTKFINECRIPMLEMVWLINQLMDIKASSPAVPCVATNFEDFHEKYELSKTTANKSWNGYKAGADAELKVALVKETVVQSIISHYHNTPPAAHAKTLFSILVNFPEIILRTALDQLRRCGVVACREKVLNNHLHRFTVQDSLQVSFRVASAYARKWINRLNTDFSDLLGDLVESDISQTNIKASPEMNCLLCEFQTVGMLEVNSIIDPIITGSSGSILQEQQLNVLDIEMKFKLKSGVVGWKKLKDFNQLSDHFKNINYEDLLPTLQRNSIVEIKNEKEKEDNLIVQHLREQGEKGMLYSELLDHFGDPTIAQKLTELENKYIITRVGFYENRIVLTEFSKPWTTTVDDKLIIPTPWLTFDCSIRRDIFFKWSAVIMNRLFEQPGCSVAYLSNTIEFLTTRAVQEILMFLRQCQCVKLNVLRVPELDLFSDDAPPEVCEFNPYEAPENIYAFPLQDALTKFAYIRNKLKPLNTEINDESSQDVNDENS